MINYISKYFVLNRRERNAIIAVSTLLVLLLGVKFYLIYFYQPSADSVSVVNIEKLAQALSSNEESKQTFVAIHKKDSLFYFNPNEITKGQAQSLGFTERQAQTFMNYRNKGAKFYNAESLKKLYFMNDELYAKLAPYVVIKNEDKFEKKEYKQAQPQYAKIEINSADSTQWMQFKGIKGGRSHMILKYKSLLGGFYSIEQIKEVYTFNDTLFNSIKDYLTCDPSKITKLKVNSVDFKTMVHHPYIKYEGTKCIFALKRNKKIVADDLINSSCFSREQLDKVLKYLDFE